MADAVGVSMGPGRSPAPPREQAVIGEVVKGFSQYGRGVHDDLLQRVHRHGARLHRGIPRDLELAHHLDGAVRSLGNGRRLTRQHGPRGDLGIDGVGLARGASRAPVAPIHVHDPMPRSAQRPCQAGAIAAGAFDAKRFNPPVCLGPRDQRLVAAPSQRRTLDRADGSPSCRSPPRRGHAYAYQRRRSPSA